MQMDPDRWLDVSMLFWVTSYVLDHLYFEVG